MTKLPVNFELDRYGLHVRLVREEDSRSDFLTLIEI